MTLVAYAPSRLRASASLVRLALRVPCALARFDDRRGQTDLLLSDAHEKHGDAYQDRYNPQIQDILPRDHAAISGGTALFFTVTPSSDTSSTASALTLR